jgi:phage protein D/phage baseplate assembly protein gpV
VKSIATLPAVLVELDGAALGDLAARRLSSARVHRRLSAPAQCELGFQGLAEGDLPPPGAQLRVAIEGQDVPLFAGQVTAVEHLFGPDREHEVRVRAYDPLHLLRKTQRARALAQVTVEDVAQELAQDLGLSVDAEAPGPLWPNLMQHRQSDLELLVRLAERCGLFVAVDDGVLRLLTLAGQGDEVELTLGEELLEARVELNADATCRSVSAAGWDPLSAEIYEATVTDSRAGREVGAQAAPGDVGAPGEVALFDEAAPNGDHVTGLAQAELDVRTAGEVTFWGLSDGNAELAPGRPVRVAGLHTAIDGRYVLTDVVHRVDEDQGFVTEMSSAPPKLLARSTAALVALGEVTSVDDPDGRGRVRVRLPSYGGLETDWLGVLAAGAGPERGLVALPDVDDRVLVLFPHEDPALGIVVGGLYGTGGPPDPGVAGAATRRFSFSTAGGQHVILDDEHGTLRFMDVTGSSLELAPEHVTLHAERDLTIEAPGHAVLVRAKTVDFEQAT